MESFFLLVPIALIFVAIALKIFFWAIKSGQYDNLETEAHRILFDEDDNDPRPQPPENREDNLTPGREGDEKAPGKTVEPRQ